MTAVSAPKTKKKKRTAVTIGSILAGVALLVGGLVVLDAWARQQVADYVTDTVREVLSLESDQPVAVEIGGTSVIAQVVTGSLERVDVGVDNVTIGELTGGVSLRADGVPVDMSKPVDRVQIEFRVGERSIQSIAHALSATAIDSVELVDDEIQFGTELSVFGVRFTVGVGVEPFASNGEIGFVPSSVEIAGTRSSAESLVQRFGSPAEQLLQTRSICVARWLPESLGVEDVEVRGDELVLTIGATRAFFDEASLAILGSCG